MDVLVVVDQLDAAVEKAVSEVTWRVGLEHDVVIVPVPTRATNWENGPERSSLLAMAVKADGVPA